MFLCLSLLSRHCTYSRGRGKQRETESHPLFPYPQNYHTSSSFFSSSEDGGGGRGGVEKWRQGRGEGTRKIKWQITRLINTCNCLPKCKAYENSKINKCNTGITSMSWSQGRRGWGGLQSIGLTWEAAASSAAMCGGEVGWGWGCICVCCLC